MNKAEKPWPWPCTMAWNQRHWPAAVAYNHHIHQQAPKQQSMTFTAACHGIHAAITVGCD